MSIPESLESLRKNFSFSGSIPERIKIIESIETAYQSESAEFAQLKKEHSVLAAEHEKFKSSAAEEIAALKAENAKLSQ